MPIVRVFGRDIDNIPLNVNKHKAGKVGKTYCVAFSGETANDEPVFGHVTNFAYVGGHLGYYCQVLELDLTGFFKNA